MWSAIETDVAQIDTGLLITARTDSFSLFAIVQSSTAPATAAMTPATSETTLATEALTATPTVLVASQTSTPTETSETPAEITTLTSTSDAGPGFTSIAALLSIILAVCLIYRRRT